MKSNRYITRDVQYELDVTGAKDILGNPVLKATVSVTLFTRRHLERAFERRLYRLFARDDSKRSRY